MRCGPGLHDLFYLALRDDLARLEEMRLQLEDRAAELGAVLARGEIATLGAAEQD